MSIELYPSIAKIKRNGVYENLPGFVPETGSIATQQMIATSESSATAQYVHEKGEYFRLNDTLYQAIVKINVGDAIVVGTNCEVAVIGNDLTHVANSIASYELGIASSSHNTGDYFMVGETLYVATSDIQVGDSISTSTNCRLAVVGDELSGLKTATTTFTANAEIQFVDGYYIATNGATVDINSPVASTSGYRYAVVDCVEGDSFTVSIKGGSTPRTFCFIDSSGNSLAVGGQNGTLTNTIITAPENAAKLVLNDTSGNKSYVGILIDERVSGLEDEVKTINHQKVFLQPGYTRNTSYGMNCVWSGKSLILNGTNTANLYYFISNYDNPPTPATKLVSSFSSAFYNTYNPQHIISVKVGHKYKLHCEILSGTITKGGVTYTNTKDMFGVDVIRYYWVGANATSQNRGDVIQSSNYTKTFVADFSTAGTFCLCVFKDCTCDNLVLEVYIEDISFDDNLAYRDKLYYGEDYWIDELNDSVESINDNTMAAGLGASTICFITDCHWWYNRKKSPSLIKHIIENCNIDHFVNGGDYLYDADSIDTKAKAIAHKTILSTCVANVCLRFARCFAISVCTKATA